MRLDRIWLFLSFKITRSYISVNYTSNSGKVLKLLVNIYIFIGYTYLHKSLLEKNKVPVHVLDVSSALCRMLYRNLYVAFNLIVLWHAPDSHFSDSDFESQSGTCENHWGFTKSTSVSSLPRCMFWYACCMPCLYLPP